jgi:hypothetical protein
MKKRPWLLLAVLMVLWVAVAAIWAVATRPAPQSVTLSDGVKYWFMGVTWGTNHTNPSDLFAARVTDHLPARLAKYVRAKFGAKLGLPVPYRTPKPSLCVWLRPEGILPTRRPGPTTYVRAMLADDSGTEAGCYSNKELPYAGQPATPLAIFSVVPRRSRMLECLLYAGAIYGGGWDTNRPPLVASGSIRFANPLYGRFSEWRPEPLRTSKYAGDLEVRLTSCFTSVGVTGWDAEAQRWTNAYGPVRPGEDAGTFLGLLATSASGTNESWALQSIELSDATGNHLTSMPYSPDVSAPGGGLPDLRGVVSGTFWPDETAVHLRLELKRTSAWPTSDLVTISNLPINAPNATNGTTLTNWAYGKPIVARNFFTKELFHFRGAPAPGPYFMEIDLPDLGPGMTIEVVKITMDKGELPGAGAGLVGMETFRRWDFRSLPTGARSFNVTLAVQKPRTVEFLVKPTKLEGEEIRR